ncbi:MAG TPA: PfkB family carbohydrate kinase [Candidatus Limnocylindrales bacterium]|nr:PfkB family carbohydrate kinase [Candidatus Limnocylindrales bacterium]
MPDTPTVVVVGAASRDIDAADPRGWRLGGTVTYSALAAAEVGVRVRALIGVDQEAAAAHELDVLRDAGVEIHLVPLSRGPVFHNQPLPDGGRAQVAVSISESIPMSALPDAWRHPSAALLGPIAAELGDDWASAFSVPTRTALAWQGMLRSLDPGQPVRPLPPTRTSLIASADALFISAEDVSGDMTPIHDLLGAGQQLVVTHGGYGAVHLSLGEHSKLDGRYLPPTPRRKPIDTIGAGDTFLGAWLAATALLAPATDPWRALLVASVTASLSVVRVNLRDHPTRADICEELVRLRDSRLG